MPVSKDGYLRKGCRALTRSTDVPISRAFSTTYEIEQPMPFSHQRFPRASLPTRSDEAPTQSVLAGIAVGLFSGLVATHVTNLAQRPLKWVTPDSVDQHEKKVRPGASSSLVAAQKLAKVLDVSPSQRETQSWGTVIHFATGIGWGPVYGLLRHYVGLRPISAALASGVGMSLVLDEGLVPALGLSAPNRHYLTFTRVRGLTAHLVYGAAVALAAEGLGHLVERSHYKRGRSSSCDRFE